MRHISTVNTRGENSSETMNWSSFIQESDDIVVCDDENENGNGNDTIQGTTSHINNISILLRTSKEYIERCLTIQEIQELKYIKEKLDFFLDRFCQHVFIDDYIDISIEYSKKIKYCKYCHKNV
jgi:hypothetical protein